MEIHLSSREDIKLESIMGRCREEMQPDQKPRMYGLECHHQGKRERINIYCTAYPVPHPINMP